MKLEIHTFDKELLPFLFQKEVVSPGEEVRLPGCSLKYDRTFSPRVVHFPQILHFEIELRDEEGPSNLVEWMKCRLKKKQVERLLIDSVEVPFEAANMKRILEEKGGF